MSTRSIIQFVALLTLCAALLAPGAGATDKPIIFGLLLVGPYNDHG